MRKDSLVLAMESLENRMVLADLSGWNINLINLPPLNNMVPNQAPVVAIVDSGLDFNHGFLKNNIWQNPFDKPGDGIDNDNNGYADDINGWNFAANNNLPQDNFYHGTSVAGIIRNIDPNVRIMPLKFQNDSGLGYTGAAATAINYATNMKLKGVNVAAINLSWGGGTSSSLVLENSIKRASDAGIVVVIAAGNNADNNDLTARYPSNYKFANTISVTAVDNNLNLAGFANYGKNTVDMAAPGVGILTSLPGDNYGYMSGTSFCAPGVAGAISLLKEFANYSASAIKQSLLYGASKIISLAEKVGSGLLNVGASLNYIKTLSNSMEVLTPIKNEVTVPVVKSHNIVSGLDTVSKTKISGWIKDINYPELKFIVKISVNNKVVYQAVANVARSDVNNGYGFSYNPKKFFKQRRNLVSISLFDSVNQKNILIDQRWVNR